LKTLLKSFLLFLILVALSLSAFSQVDSVELTPADSIYYSTRYCNIGIEYYNFPKSWNCSIVRFDPTTNNHKDDIGLINVIQIIGQVIGKDTNGITCYLGSGVRNDVYYKRGEIDSFRLAYVDFMPQYWKVTILGKKPVETTVVTSLNKENIKVYPNPCIYILTIEANKTADVIITDMVGRVVLKSKVFDKINVDVSKLTTGMYLIKVGNEKPIKIFKR
jgi:hypothetical protein